MLKNNSGYDLKQLFIGTVGTLGVVTKVVLRLEPSIASRDVAMVALGSFEAVLKLQSDAKRILAADMLSFEVMWGAYYDAEIERAHVCTTVTTPQLVCPL